MMKRASPENTSSGPLPKRSLEDDTPRFKGCSSIKRYELMGKLGEGTFGYVQLNGRVRPPDIGAIDKRVQPRGIHNWI